MMSASGPSKMQGEADVGEGAGDSQGSDIVVATVIVFLAVEPRGFQAFQLSLSCNDKSRTVVFLN